MGFFSKKKVSPSAKQTCKTIDAMQMIRLSIENAEKREKFLQNKIDNVLLTQAKSKMAQGDKRSAMNLMKRKKMYQAEIEKLDNVRMTLETQAIQLESAAHNQDTITAMQTGTSAMKRIRKSFGIDKVDELVENIRDEADTAEEISRAIATPLDPYMMDDDDLMRELNELDDLTISTSNNTTKKQETTSFWSMPSIPNRKTQHQKDREDLKKLEAEMMLA